VQKLMLKPSLKPSREPWLMERINPD